MGRHKESRGSNMALGRQSGQDRKPTSTPPQSQPKQSWIQRLKNKLMGTSGLDQQQSLVKPPPTGEKQQTIRELAESITQAGGHGAAGDVKVVVDEMIKIPRGGLEALKKKGTKVIACHDSVTDVMTELKGVQPRGWPSGMTWDSVPGLYDPSGNRVIIATKDGKVPPTGQGHGSANLVIHEVGHAIDAAGGNISSSEAFKKAREKDVGNLTAYEKQTGTAGLEESYAESMARYYGGAKDEAENFKGLHEYWAGNPLDNVTVK
jgi:hypothetical protein